MTTESVSLSHCFFLLEGHPITQIPDTMDLRLIVLGVVLLTVLSLSTAKTTYHKRHFHYQKIYAPSPKIPHGKPAKVAVYTKKPSANPHKPQNYEFGYKIHDPQHKNYQEKLETRNGDAVQGYYSLLEPNGEVRVVRYQSDDSGFHSKVTHHKHSERSHRTFSRFP